MVILSIEEEVEEEVEVEEDENGFKKGKWIDLMERFRSGYSQGNGIETQQTATDRSQPNRQEEDWSMPTNVERRENETERHEISQAPLPDIPPPMEDRLFTDWSSIDSLRERVPPHNQSARSVEPNITLTVNQTEQPTVDPEGNEAYG